MIPIVHSHTKHVQLQTKKKYLLATDGTDTHSLGQAHHSLVSPFTSNDLAPIIGQSYREKLPAEQTVQRAKSVNKTLFSVTRQPNKQDRTSLLTANSWWWYRINSYDRPFSNDLLGQVSDIGAVQGLRNNHNRRINLMLFCFRCKAAIGFFEECRRRAIYDMKKGRVWRCW